MNLFKKKRDPMVEHVLNEIHNFEIKFYEVCAITKNLKMRATHNDFQFSYHEIYYNHIVWELLVFSGSGTLEYTLSDKDATEIKNKLCDFRNNEKWFKDQAKNIEIGEQYFTQKLKDIKR